MPEDHGYGLMPLPPDIQGTVQAITDAQPHADCQILTTLAQAKADILAALPVLDGHEDDMLRLACLLADDALKNAPDHLAADTPLLLRIAGQGQDSGISPIVPADETALVAIVPSLGEQTLYAKTGAGMPLNRLDDWAAGRGNRLVMVAAQAGELAHAMAGDEFLKRQHLVSAEETQAYQKVTGKIASMLNQAIADTALSLESQTALVGLLGSLRQLGGNLRAYLSAIHAQDKSAYPTTTDQLLQKSTDIRHNVQNVEQGIKGQIVNMALSDTLRQRMRGGLQELQKIKAESAAPALSATVGATFQKPLSAKAHVSLTPHIAGAAAARASSIIVPTALMERVAAAQAQPARTSTRAPASGIVSPSLPNALGVVPSAKQRHATAPVRAETLDTSAFVAMGLTAAAAAPAVAAAIPNHTAPANIISLMERNEPGHPLVTIQPQSSITSITPVSNATSYNLPAQSLAATAGTNSPVWSLPLPAILPGASPGGSESAPVAGITRSATYALSYSPALEPVMPPSHPAVVPSRATQTIGRTVPHVIEASVGSTVTASAVILGSSPLHETATRQIHPRADAVNSQLISALHDTGERRRDISPRGAIDTLPMVEAKTETNRISTRGAGAAHIPQGETTVTVMKKNTISRISDLLRKFKAGAKSMCDGCNGERGCCDRPPVHVDQLSLEKRALALRQG